MLVSNENNVNNAGALSEGVVNGRVGERCDNHQTVTKRSHQKLRLANLNVKTLKGRSSEVVETLTRRDNRYLLFTGSKMKGLRGQVYQRERF